MGANGDGVSNLKELHHDILSCFGGSRKLLLIGRKPLNNSLPG